MSPLEPQGDKTRKQTFAFQIHYKAYLHPRPSEVAIHVKNRVEKSSLFPSSCCRFLNTPQKGSSAHRNSSIMSCALTLLPNLARGTFKPKSEFSLLYHCWIFLLTLFGKFWYSKQYQFQAVLSNYYRLQIFLIQLFVKKDLKVENKPFSVHV